MLCLNSNIFHIVYFNLITIIINLIEANCTKEFFNKRETEIKSIDNNEGNMRENEGHLPTTKANAR